MKSSTVFSADGRLNTKIKRVQDLKKEVGNDDLPSSYKTNSTQEELCFEYISSFLEQFMSLHPKRKVPFMVAENEYGVKKFVCSTVRPSQIPASELYDMYECASFFAGFILYEPLDPPTQYPKYLISPTQTVKANSGDCFDLAILLCSFLIGNGYDAYVVNGYAPSYITLRDQSNTLCPLISSTNTTAQLDSEINKYSMKRGADVDSGEVDPENPYVPPDNGVKDSAFVNEQDEIARKAMLDPFRLWIEEDKKETVIDDSKTSPKGDKMPVHAWVLVRAGKRDVKEHVFLEPTTGRAYPITASPYWGIEAVWNDSNYYINIIDSTKVSEIDFDVTNQNVWEYLFVKSTYSQLLAANNAMQASNASLLGGDGGGDEAGGGTAAPAAALVENTGGTDEGAAGSGDIERFLDPPPTWVEPVTIDRAAMLLRYPPLGRRTILYLRAKADFYAKNSHPQGMVMRIVTFLDNDRTIVNETFEWYENRRDKMYKRVRSLLGSHRFVEYFHPGSLGEVKLWIEYPGKKTDVHFYVDGRIDRLKRRLDIHGAKSVEYFEDRIDRITYRSTHLTADKHVTSGSRQLAMPGYGLAPEVFILKMTQVYSHDPDVPMNGSDISRRVFFVKDGKAVFQYHFAEGKITSQVKTYNHSRGSSSIIGSSAPHAGGMANASQGPGIDGPPAGGPPSNFAPEAGGSVGGGAAANSLYVDESAQDDDMVGLQEAGSLERECYASIKVAQAQMQQIIEFRFEMESNVAVERSVFEEALNASDAAAASAGGGPSPTGGAVGDAVSDGKGSDFLTPYLRHIPDISKITKEEAIEIRQVCLDALKTRLVERANIVQFRLNDENARLARKQEQFQRSQREGELSTEEYEKYCTDAMFRIQILEQRLVAHDESALKKFSDLDMKLANDPRLRVLKAGNTTAAPAPTAGTVNNHHHK